MGEDGQYDHIEYFQGFAQMRERGLPTKLLAEKKKALEDDPELFELQEELSQLQKAKAPKTEFNTARNNVWNCRGRLRDKALKKYQSEWVRQRRDWKIDTRGKIRAEDDTKTDLENVLTKMMPARGRIATIMVSDRAATEEERKGCIEELCSLISLDVITMSLPGENPIDGLYPVKDCVQAVIR